MYMTTQHSLDSLNVRKMILTMPEQISNAISAAGNFKLVDPVIDKIVIVGMGGSGIAGDILKTYMRKESFRIEVVKDYSLPSFVDEKALVIVCSYSGNTEETISAYRDAVRRRCKILALTTGGKLQELCKMNNHEHILLQKGYQPRQAAPFMFFVMLKVLENSRLIQNQNEFIEETITALKRPVYDDMARELAVSLKGKIPLIYSSDKLASIAYRWKCELNENAKIHTFTHVLAEMNHNEIVGFTKKMGEFHVVFLKDSKDSEKIHKRIKITKELIKQKGVPATEILVKGSNELTRLFSALLIGDLTSYYLALEYELDPGPVNIIEDLKEMLKE